MSSLIGKSIQHVHRYAGFLQCIEFGYDICMEYVARFEQFPVARNIEKVFVERAEGIFKEMFYKRMNDGNEEAQFIIRIEIVNRAIDLVSGLLQQLNILMDDTHAPSGVGNVTRSVVVMPASSIDRLSDEEIRKRKKRKNDGNSFDDVDIDCVFNPYFSVFHPTNEKLMRLAVEILFFPSLCFTVTQLHVNNFIHNVSSADIHCVLEHLVKYELLECIRQGIKTTRRTTSVYVKRLPLRGQDGQVENDQAVVFSEKLKEFTSLTKELSVNEYLKSNMMIKLNAVGHVTDELIHFFSLPEYMKVDLNPLYQLKETGSFDRLLSLD